MPFICGNNEGVPLGQREEFSIKIHRVCKDDQSGAQLRTDLVLKPWTSCFLSIEINVNYCVQLSDLRHVNGHSVPVFYPRVL